MQKKFDNGRKPLIGIVGKPLLNEQLNKTLWKRIVINDEVRQLVVKYGGIAIGIMPYFYYDNMDTSNKVEKISVYEKEYLLEQLLLLDGIILQGGLTSDTYEMEIVRYAIKNNVPIIGICAGFNNIARAFDIPVKHKSIYDEIHNIYDSAYIHSVNINLSHRYYRLINAKTINVNSLHSMFVENANIPDDIEVLAISIDGKSKNHSLEHIEAFSVKNTKFCMAIKWHPELMMKENSTINIFKEFIKMCKEFQAGL